MLSAIFLWSSLGVVIRLSGVPVHQLIFYSTLVSVIAQGVFVARKRYRALVPGGRGVLLIMVLGPVLLLNTSTFFYAMKVTTISNAIMTHYIAPVVVAFLAAIFLKEPITKRLLVAILLSSVGLWVLLDTGLSEILLVFSEPNIETLGILSGLFSGFVYAILILMVRVFAQNHHPLVLTFFQNVTICLILAPFIRDFPVEALWSFVLMGTVHATAAPLLYFKGLSMVRAGRAAVLGYLEPVCAVLFAAIFLGEHPSPASLSGGALILLAGFITLRGDG